jgi:exosortase family protein XrtM
MYPTTSPLSPAPKPMNGLFVVILAATYFILYAAYSLVPESFLADNVYYYGIVCPSKTLINWISSGEHAMGAGNSLTSSTVNLNIVRGCDGSGVAFLLIAAIVAVRESPRRTLIGIVGALALVYALNQLRIVALYFIASRWLSWFTPMHVYFIPTLIILVATIYYAAWTAYPQYEVRHSSSR